MVEGTPLLREHAVKSCIEGSNPSVSANKSGFVTAVRLLDRKARATPRSEWVAFLCLQFFIQIVLLGGLLPPISPSVYSVVPMF